MNFRILSGQPRRVGTVVLVAAVLCGCSAMSDMFGGDSDAPAPPADQTAQTGDTAQPAAPPASNAPYPDLADTPDRPAAPSTPDDQKQVTQSLGAQGANQNYAADQLRAGTEAAAPPPSAEAPQEDIAQVDTSSKVSAAGSPPAPSSSDSSDKDSAPDNSPAPAKSSSTSTSAPAASGSADSAVVPAPTTAVASVSTPAPAAAPMPAMSGPTSGPPAVPANSVVGAQPTQMTDSQLGFQPSKAPPLDASVAQFVPQPIIARYRQTASIGGVAVVNGGPAVPAVPSASYGQSAGVTPAYGDASGPAVATILFPRDTTILSAAAKEQVQATAHAFSAQGSVGYIRVVGHASSRTANMSPSRHLQWDFEHSQARANSVARALIAAGVPPTKVLVNAVGDDNQSGADGGHRADIFIQS